MKKNKHVMAAIGMALLASGALESDPTMRVQSYDQDYPPIPKPKNKPVLSGIKHIGVIPKGCFLEKAEVIIPWENHHVSIIVEIVFATRKSFVQKLEKKQREICSYIINVGIEGLKKDERFNVTEIASYQVLPPQLPEQPENGRIQEMTIDEFIEKFGEEFSDEQKVELARFKK